MAKQWTSPIGRATAEAAEERAASDPEYRRLLDERAPYREVAWLLIRYRMDHNLTQQELADRVRTSHSQISRIESGRHATSLNTLRRIAEALDLRLVVGFESTDTRGKPKRDVVTV